MQSRSGYRGLVKRRYNDTDREISKKIVIVKPCIRLAGTVGGWG